ncbi:MAG: phosphate ABC transporter, permease protein PstA [Thaumarchaeota archaeon 13_1_40CM_3_50_5]|nr:MAG: phosphate ABC transporter, permease protein PstA [Thaumarchaeota archaeon 13_1_40CM_3_50_5]
MSNYSFRRFKDRLAFAIGFLCIGLAIIPLGSILLEVIARGLPALNPEFLTATPGIIGQSGGGIANAIQGTLVLIGLTCVIGVPIGVLAGIYLSEFGNNKFGRTIRFLNDVLTEFPSIVVGILAFVLVVLATRRFSALAGAIALSVIMLPIVARTTEESLKLVPSTVRDGGMALGIRKWRTTLSIVLSAGKSGVVTGVLLSIARVAGETAPLLLTVLGTNQFFSGLDKPVDALPLRIYTYALLPYPYAQQQGWGAALVLIMIVLSINVTVKLVTRRKM